MQKKLLLLQKKKLIFVFFLFFFSTSFAQQKIIVTGNVVTENYVPLAGVSVHLKGSSGGTTTDAHGKFTIQASKGAALVLSFVGYKEKQVKIIDEKSVENIQMVSIASTLGEVVVIGYGTEKKEDVTTAVSTISSKQIANRPSMGLLEAMSGQMAGVDIQEGGAQPGGANMIIRIRGTNSISGSSDPLYVVDGVPMPDALSAINPDDVASVTVLKDVSATAIYGSRGSSGVVLITTKKGKIGPPVISFSTSVGFQQIAKKIPMTGKADYLKLLIAAKNQSWIDKNPSVNQATDDNATRYANGAGSSLNYIIPDGETNPWGTFTYDIQNPTDVAKMSNTNWQNLIFKNALTTQDGISISGGTDKTRYVISGNYEYQDGIMILSNFERFNTRAYVESKVKKNFTVGLELMANTGDGRLQAEARNAPLGGYGINLAALSLAPVFPQKNPDGTYADMQRDPGILGAGQGGYNALELANNRYHYQKSYGWSSFGFADWKILPNLDYRFTLNGTFANSEESFFEPEGVNDYGVTTTGTTSSNSQGNTRSYLMENLLNYNTTFAKKNNIAVLGGYTVEKALIGSIFASADDAPTNYVQLVTGTPVSATTGASENALISYLGRVRYNYDERYMLTGSVRWDGSSRFAPGHKWGFFPSVSAGWNISKEKFMRNVNLISDLKIRGGWGISGNNGIGDFEWQGNLGGVYYPLGNPQNELFGVPQGNQQQNNNLTWEKTRETNIGFDLGLLNNRIYLTGDYYSRISYDLLLNIPTPVISGQTTYLTNEGKMRNSGVELTINTTNMIRRNFTWSTNFNISHNVNKVLELGPGNAPIFPTSSISHGPYFETAVGLPISSFYGYQVEGIFQNEADLAKHVQVNPGKDRPGQFYFEDVNKDGLINASDKTNIGNNQPVFDAGMTNNFTYKNFSLDLQLSSSYGGKTYSIFYREIMHGSSGSRGMPKYLLNRWISPTQPGNGKVPAITTVEQGYDTEGSSYWVQNNSYLRIRNVSLGYNVNGEVLKRLHVQKLKVYVSAYNLYTFTKYIGYDPESNTSYFDDNAGGSLASGGDYLAYPTARTFSLGANLSF